jgi:hypothetical protein
MISGGTLPSNVSLSYGMDADKPENPKEGAMYLATDLGIFYVCYSTGIWSNAAPELTKTAIDDAIGFTSKDLTKTNIDNAIGFTSKDLTKTNIDNAIGFMSKDVTSTTISSALGFTPSKVRSGQYAGNDTANRAITHGLGATPSMVIIFMEYSSYTEIIVNNGNVVHPMSDPATDYAVTAATSTSFYVGNATNYDESGNGGGKSYGWIAFV